MDCAGEATRGGCFREQAGISTCSDDYPENAWRAAAEVGAVETQHDFPTGEVVVSRLAAQLALCCDGHGHLQGVCTELPY